jgi:hypothetical protein
LGVLLAIALLLIVLYFVFASKNNDNAAERDSSNMQDAHSEIFVVQPQQPQQQQQQQQPQQPQQQQYRSFATDDATRTSHYNDWNKASNPQATHYQTPEIHSNYGDITDL